MNQMNQNSDPTDLNVELGKHFENVADMIALLVPTDLESGNAVQDAKIALTHLYDHLKQKGGVEVERPSAFLTNVRDHTVTLNNLGVLISK